MRMKARRKMRVRNFSYNGFCGTLLSGYTNYTACFERWTSDPGVAKCRCSDRQTRLIPTYALAGFDPEIFPPQDPTDVVFGVPCRS